MAHSCRYMNTLSNGSLPATTKRIKERKRHKKKRRKYARYEKKKYISIRREKIEEFGTILVGGGPVGGASGQNRPKSWFFNLN